MDAILTVFIRILEIAFFAGILGSAVVIIWVFIEDFLAIRGSKESRDNSDTSVAA